MAVSSALRLVTACTNLAEFVATFRASVDGDGFAVELAEPPPPTDGPCRVVVALANRATVLDGDAAFALAADGRVVVRFARLDVRSRGLLQHLVDARAAAALAAIPRHLVPLGAPVGDPATARATSAACMLEPMGPRPADPPRRAMPALPTLRGRPSTAPPPAAGAPPAIAPPTVAPPVIAPPAIAAPVADPPSGPAKPRRRRESQPTLLGVSAPRVAAVDADTDPRRPMPGAPGRDAPDFESTLHGPAPVRAPGDLTTPDLRPGAGTTLRGPAVSPEFDTGESEPAPSAGDDLITDVALALPDDVEDDVDPLAEPPSPSALPPRGMAMAVSKASAMPRAVAAAYGPTAVADVAVTAPMAAPPAAMLEAHPSAAVAVAAAAVATAPMTAPVGRPPAIAPGPPRTPVHGSPSIPAPPAPAPQAIPIVAPPPPAPQAIPIVAPPVTRPTPAPGAMPPVTRPTPAPGAMPPVTRPTPAPGAMPPVTRPTPAPGAMPPVTRPTPAPGAMPMAAPPPPMAYGTGAASVPHPGAWPTPGWAPPAPPAAPGYPPPGAYPAPAPPPSYPTAQVRALDAPPGASSSWQRHQAAMREDGGDMTEIIAVPRVRRRRWPVIAITSAVVVVIAIVIIALTSGGSSTDAAPTPPPPPPAPTAVPARPTPEAPPPTVAPPTAPPPTPAPPAPPAAAAAPPAATTCEVAFTSSPDGAEVIVDGRALGVTPLEVEVPCDARKVELRRDRYQALTRPLALKPGTQPVDVRLERPTFTVTVASRPAGATVTLGGRVVGKTPVKLSVAGFEGNPVELTLPGYRPHRERVYATKAGQRFDVRLSRR